MKPLCADCDAAPRMHASSYCRACKHTRRKAYWKDRDDGRDYPDQLIEAKYLAARLEKRPWERARRLTTGAAIVTVRP